MELDKDMLMQAVNQSVKELEQRIEMHHCLIASILNQTVDDRNLKKIMDYCPIRSREVYFKEAIEEAIDVLEESRKAFKSKRLEALRKKLTQVLIEA
jgi:hypothetical protein